jgi:hypothetical protein
VQAQELIINWKPELIIHHPDEMEAAGQRVIAITMFIMQADTIDIAKSGRGRYRALKQRFWKETKKGKQRKKSWKVYVSYYKNRSRTTRPQAHAGKKSASDKSLQPSRRAGKEFRRDQQRATPKNI